MRIAFRIKQFSFDDALFLRRGVLEEKILLRHHFRALAELKTEPVFALAAHAGQFYVETLLLLRRRLETKLPLPVPEGTLAVSLHPVVEGEGA